MSTNGEAAASTIVDRVVEHAVATLPDRAELGLSLRRYFAHIPDADLEARRVEDLFGLAIDHLEQATKWEEGTASIQVTNPRVELDGWRSDHTIVRIVTEDIPFLVDSVTMELSRLGLGIHFVLHPILPFAGRQNGDDDRSLSLICMEIDRVSLDERQAGLVDDLQRVIADVRMAVRDWAPMRDRLREISGRLGEDRLPLDDDEVAESRALLDWLAEDHFIFLGARDYELITIDGNEVLRIVPGSGLGILHSNEHLGRPRRIDELSPGARDRVHEVRLLNLTKAGSKSTVHRPSYLDYVGVKTFDDRGNVSGERRFLGLFTSELYTRSIEEIPKIRRTAAAVVADAGYSAGGHDETRLRAILEQYPRDDLLQMEVDELATVSIAIAGLQERRRVRVFPRRELFGRFVTVLVYLPRDRYNTDTRSGIEQLLIDTYGGSLADWDAQMSESVLARLRFVLRVDGEPLEDLTAGEAELEAGVEALIHVWDDDFAEALVGQFGEDTALEMRRTFGAAFGVNYQAAFDPRVAAADVAHLAALGEPGTLRLSAYRRPGLPSNAFKLKVFSRGERVSLTAVMPSLTNLGVTVLDESPYEVRPAGGDPVWIYDFALEYAAVEDEGPEFEFSTVSGLVEEAFAAVWSGAVEDDGFNRLVLRAGLRPGEVAVIRAYAKYLHQIRLPYSTTFVEQTLAEHPAIVRMLFELFAARFTVDRFALDQEAGTDAVAQRVLDAIDSIESLDHDRVLRRILNLIEATLRTTWAQVGDDAVERPYLGFKFDCAAIDELPKPRPAYEIFVYAPDFEGVHLRAGAVARGGLRWSDRTEDYRTEVLGLVKA
ncbi:MAG: NAD-glutamate dehydrogenase domain-containing protein, partial [Acidimicrobiales bacterium]